jgi:aryl-alcohol dehydrogenase-like predicted oxidoreductase
MRRGQVRWIGCSNLAAWQVCKSLWRQDVLGLARFESVQPIYNLVHRDIEEELLPLCADQQLGVMTYSPLGAGFLSGKYRRGEAVPGGSRFDIKPGHQSIYFTDRGFRIMEGLRALAVEAGVPMPALALAWVMKRAGITSVLIGARSVGQVDQAFEAEALRISQSVSARLDAL